MEDQKEKKLALIFSEYRHEKINIKNRLMMMPMLTRFCDQNGYVTDRYIDYMVARAKGGVGIIATGLTCMTKDAQFRPNQLACLDETYIEGLKKLTDAIHKHDCKILLQLNHAGTRLSESRLPGSIPVGPTALRYISTGVVPHELTVKEIEKIIDDFGECARRARTAGFDGVDIHGAHGYLLSQFCSPFYNKRQDEYGGNPERRAKLSVEIVKRVREYCGNDFPLFYRLQGSDYTPGGIVIEEAKIHAKMIEDAGIDFLNVSAGSREAADMQVQPNLYDRGCLLHLTEAIRKEVKVPIIAVGRIVDPFQAEKILKDGIADIIGMARAFLADPDFPNKAREGRYQEINQCVGCNTGCIDKDLKKYPAITCAINPECGNEHEINKTLPPKRKKKVVIVGGGPAGMACAKAAAERGHDVTIFEKGDSLGGQLLVASVPEGKYELSKIQRWYSYQFESLGVDVRYRTVATPSIINGINPDTIVLGTGSEPIKPNVPGIYGDNVITAIDVLKGYSEIGENIVVVGGGMIGLEISEYLVKKGKKVVIVEQQKKVAMDVGLTQRLAHWRRLVRTRIPIYTDATLSEVFHNGINVIMKMGIEDEERKGDENVFLPADNVVLATGMKPMKIELEKWKEKAEEVYMIGDCVEPSLLIDAIHAGARLGFKL